MEITRSDWDFIQNQEDPAFVSKFEGLLKRYIDNAWNDPDTFTDRRAVGYIKEWSAQSNWLCKMRLDDLKVFTRKNGVDKTRFETFIYHANAIGMLYDYQRFFGDTPESQKQFFYAYLQMLNQHKRGYEAEKAAQMKSAKSSPYGEAAASLTGAKAKKGFVSGILDKFRKKDKGDKGDQDYGE